MKSAIDVAKHRRSSRYLNIALTFAVTIQIVLYFNQTGGNEFFQLGPVVQEIFYLVSLLLLVGVVFSRCLYNGKLTRRAEEGRNQTDAMSSMFSGVKHKLNNDMQVVLGNAELAGILVNNGGDVTRPVHNITAAANDAVQRIEQLSVFGSSGNATPKPVDLNSMFRESMVKLAAELPVAVTLRLELEHLSTQVVADRHLLSLSLTHFIRLAALSMRHGGEIIVQTCESDVPALEVHTPVIARIHIKRAQEGQTAAGDQQVNGFDHQRKRPLADDVEQFQHGFKTTQALVERSGAKNVSLFRRGDESLFSMGFAIEMQSKSVQQDLMIAQLNS